jgi:hypothetical protein
VRRLTRRAAVPPRAIRVAAAIGVRRLAVRIGAALRAATAVRTLAATASRTRAGPPAEVPRTAAVTVSAIADTKAVGAASLIADVVMGRSITAPEVTAAGRGTSATAGMVITADAASAVRTGVRGTIMLRHMDGTLVIGSTAAMLGDTTSVRAVTATEATATLVGAAFASATTRMIAAASATTDAADTAILALAVAVINNIVGAADTTFITGKGGEVSLALIV